MVVHTKDSNSAFVARVAEPKAELVVPDEQKFIVLNDVKFVTADGEYVMTETKFVFS
jgi:hypothetical protein